jgi:hypothetical protein
MSGVSGRVTVGPSVQSQFRRDALRINELTTRLTAAVQDRDRHAAAQQVSDARLQAVTAERDQQSALLFQRESLIQRIVAETQTLRILNMELQRGLTTSCSARQRLLREARRMLLKIARLKRQLAIATAEPNV